MNRGAGRVSRYGRCAVLLAACHWWRRRPPGIMEREDRTNDGDSRRVMNRYVACVTLSHDNGDAAIAAAFAGEQGLQVLVEPSGMLLLGAERRATLLPFVWSVVASGCAQRAGVGRDGATATALGRLADEHEVLVDGRVLGWRSRWSTGHRGSVSVPGVAGWVSVHQLSGPSPERAADPALFEPWPFW